MKCKRELPRLDCPSCQEPMERFEMQGITRDQCDPCDGVWFDTGEISAVYQRQPVQGLAASRVDEHAADDEPSPVELMLSIVLQLLAPVAPLFLR